MPVVSIGWEGVVRSQGIPCYPFHERGLELPGVASGQMAWDKPIAGTRFQAMHSATEAGEVSHRHGRLRLRELRRDDGVLWTMLGGYGPGVCSWGHPRAKLICIDMAGGHDHPSEG